MHSADFSKCIFYVFLVVISVSERQFFPARSEPCERCRIDIIDVLQFVTNKIEAVFANQILIIIFSSGSRRFRSSIAKLGQR